MPPDTAASPQVAILLGTYNGEKYLPEQLDSYASQSYGNWKAWASDDSSSDATPKLLNDYQRKWGEEKLAIINGPARGCTRNFLSLATNPAIVADYYAFSDQDDIWEPDKLQRALDWLQTQPQDIPALYCSRTMFVDEANHDIGVSQLYTRPPAFANALVQNIASGNTMVFNHAARQLLCASGADADVYIHDWWLYLLVTACGGPVHYDPHPTLRYRQHDINLIGMNTGWKARLARIRMLFAGRLAEWDEQHVRALQKLDSHLIATTKQTLRLFAMARHRRLLPRLVGFKRAGIYRQTRLGNVGLLIAAAFGKL
ncbi:glycosyltransferase family 2 protein [Candidimonas humi]|nr:glycosyltransferase family 2 protein [Candidimonas humi]